MQETQKTWVQSLGQEEPWRRKWQPASVFLPGKSQGQRSLAGYSPWGQKESDMTEHTHTCVLSCFSHSIMLLHLFIGFFSVKNNSSSTWIFSTIFISMTFLDSPRLFFFNLYYPLQSVFSLMNARSRILTVVVPSCRLLQSFACPC